MKGTSFQEIEISKFAYRDSSYLYGCSRTFSENKSPKFSTQKISVRKIAPEIFDEKNLHQNILNKKSFQSNNLSCILFRFGMASAGMILMRLSVRITSWTYQGRPSGIWTNFASSSVCTHWALLSCSSQMHPDGHWDWARVNNPINIVSIISKPIFSIWKCWLFRNSTDFDLGADQRKSQIRSDEWVRESLNQEGKIWMVLV